MATSLRFDISALDRASEKFDQIGDKVEALAARLRALDGQKVKPDVKVKVDSSELTSLSARLRSIGDRTVTVSARAGRVSDVDVAARLNIDRGHFAAQVRRLEPVHLDTRLDVDRGLGRLTRALGSANSGVTGLSRSVGGLSGTFRTSFTPSVLGAVGAVVKLSAIAGTATVAGAGITAAWGVASTAVAAMPAALSLVIAPAAAVKIGMDGIAEAASVLSDEWGNLQTAVEAEFLQRLTPVFESLADDVMPALQDGLVDVAGGLSTVAERVAAFIRSAEGVELLEDTFAGVTTALEEMSPGIEDVVAGLLTVASQSGAFDALTEGVNRFGDQFRTDVRDLITDGTMQEAFRGLGGLLGELGEGFSSLVRNGIEVFAAAAPGLNDLLDSITGFFNRFDWSDLGRSVGGVFSGLARAIDDVDQSAIDGIQEGFRRIKDLFQSRDFQANLTQFIESFPVLIDLAGRLTDAIVRLAGAAGGFATVLQGLGQIKEGIEDFDWGKVSAGMETVQRGVDEIDGALVGVARSLTTVAEKFAVLPDQKTITVDSLTDSARRKLEELGFTVRELPNGEIEITAKDELARQRLIDFVTGVETTTATLALDANPDPATGKITQTVQFGNGQTAVFTLDANPDPATGKITGTVQFADGSVGTITVDGNPDPATGKINAVVEYGNNSPTTITINPRDLVSSVIDRLKRPTSSTHTIFVREVNLNQTRNTTGSGGRGGREFAAGGIAVAGMAPGGLLGLRRMSARVASIVPPRTMRIIGDRMTDDEAFIPINQSRRSREILQQTAARMGFSLNPKFGAIVQGPAAAGGGSESRVLLAIHRETATQNGYLRSLVGEVRELRRTVGEAPNRRSTAAEINAEMRRASTFGMNRR